jgi:hypothetical protein
VVGNASAHCTASAESGRSPASWVPPTRTNVSVDPITDAGRHPRRGYRRGMEAATRDGEHARSRYALSGNLALVAAVAIVRSRAASRRTGFVDAAAALDGPGANYRREPKAGTTAYSIPGGVGSRALLRRDGRW